MKTPIITLTLFALSTTTLHAQDIEYHYRNVGGVSKCVNKNNQEGFNLGYLGECGQVSGKKFDSPSLHQAIAGLEAIGTEFDSADFAGSSFIDCKFNTSQLTDSNWKSVLIRKSKLEKANLSRANAKGSLVIQSDFDQADMSSMNWAGSSITQTQMKQATLKSATFDSSLLTDVSFEKADLRGADFQNSSITSTNFQNADLRGANFTGVLLGSSLSWSGARFDSSTKLPFSETQAIQYGMLKDR